MKVKILRGTVADGQRVKVGDTPEVSTRTGNFLVAIGKAEPAEKVEKPADLSTKTGPTAKNKG